MNTREKYEEMLESFIPTKEEMNNAIKKANTSDLKAQKRKECPMYSGLLTYFPNALSYVSHVSYVGQQQHNPDKPLAWDRSKSSDEPDALIRHLTDHSINPVDDDGLYHLGKVAWRALAMLEKHLESN